MRVLTTAGAIGLLAGAVVAAQAPVPNPTNKTGVIGLMHAIHSTNDVDKTLAFYQAVFGLQGQVRPFQSTGPQILTDSPGAALRIGWLLEPESQASFCCGMPPTEGYCGCA